MQSNKKSFKGQNIFIGIDVHAKTWSVETLTESEFNGFSTYYELKEYGMECMVVHAADIPTSQYEEIMKTDKEMPVSWLVPCAMES